MLKSFARTFGKAYRKNKIISNCYHPSVECRYYFLAQSPQIFNELNSQFFTDYVSQLILVVTISKLHIFYSVDCRQTIFIKLEPV